MHYKAFGLYIDSEIKLNQLPEATSDKTDVRICYGKVPETLDGQFVEYDWILIKRDEVLFRVDTIASYYVKNGDTIIIEKSLELKSENKALLQVYLMGTAMGALLIQRSILPLHGSCVIGDDNKVILFTGVSGAGKSTTASVFLKKGWKLISDDITPVKNIENKVIAYPSFPQQKLWEDAVLRLELDENRRQVLWGYDENLKYAMNSASVFHDHEEYLQYVFQLVPKEQEEVTCKEIIGVEKAILLREHTYREFLYADIEMKNSHFQMCADLAGKLKVFHVYRPIGKESEQQVFEVINKVIYQ